MASDSNFVTVAGIVQFDPQEREVQGKEVRDITIRGIGTGKKYRITLWPDLAAAEVARGDFVAVDGKGSTNTVQTDNGPVTYYNVSATHIVVNGTVYSREREEVVNEAPSAQTDDIPF